MRWIWIPSRRQRAQSGRHDEKDLFLMMRGKKRTGTRRRQRNLVVRLRRRRVPRPMQGEQGGRLPLWCLGSLASLPMPLRHAKHPPVQLQRVPERYFWIASGLTFRPRLKVMRKRMSLNFLTRRMISRLLRHGHRILPLLNEINGVGRLGRGKVVRRGGI